MCNEFESLRQADTPATSVHALFMTTEFTFQVAIVTNEVMSMECRVRKWPYYKANVYSGYFFFSSFGKTLVNHPIKSSETFTFTVL